MRSSITIDGLTLHGNAKDVSILFLAVSTALEDLADGSTWVPSTGEDDNGRIVSQMVRLTSQSAVAVSIVDDGTLPSAYFEVFERARSTFHEKYTQADE